MTVCIGSRPGDGHQEEHHQASYVHWHVRVSEVEAGASVLKLQQAGDLVSLSRRRHRSRLFPGATVSIRHPDRQLCRVLRSGRNLCLRNGEVFGETCGKVWIWLIC